MFLHLCIILFTGGVGFPACTGMGGWLPSMYWEGGGELASQHALGRGRGVGFPACTGKGRELAFQHALGRRRGLASQHVPELGKVGSMYPTGMLSCVKVVLYDIVMCSVTKSKRSN